MWSYILEVLCAIRLGVWLGCFLFRCLSLTSSRVANLRSRLGRRRECAGAAARRVRRRWALEAFIQRGANAYESELPRILAFPRHFQSLVSLRYPSPPPETGSGGWTHRTRQASPSQSPVDSLPFYFRKRGNAFGIVVGAVAVREKEYCRRQEGSYRSPNPLLLGGEFGSLSLPSQSCLLIGQPVPSMKDSVQAWQHEKCQECR